MDRSTTSSKGQFAVLAVVVGPFAAIAFAAATATASDDMSVANVALVLAMITVAAALTQWSAGVLTSIAAALSLNYFHTEPVHSLRMSDGTDVLAVVLLGLLGVGVSAATALRVRRSVVRRHEAGSASVASRLSSSLHAPQPAVELWHGAIDVATPQLAMVDARLERNGTSGLPVVARGSEQDVIVLTEAGAVVPFRNPRHADQLVLVPRQGLGPITLDRRIVFAFADELELALEGRLGRTDFSPLRTR